VNEIGWNIIYNYMKDLATKITSMKFEPSIVWRALQEGLQHQAL